MLPNTDIAQAWIAFVTKRGAEIILEKGLTPETCSPADLKSAAQAAHGERQASLQELMAGETEKAQTIRKALLDDVYGRLT